MIIGRSKNSGNEVYLDKQGIIRSIYRGYQTVEIVESTYERIMKIIVKLIRQDRPVWILADIRDLGQYDQPSRLVDMYARTVMPYWRMAVVTTEPQPVGEKVSRQLTAMSGRQHEIRYFHHEYDAIGWLVSMEEKTPKITPSKNPTSWTIP